MKRLPINADDRSFLLSLEGDAGMVVWLMLKIYPMPINADSLTFELKWDQRKSRARKVLDDLSADGFTALMKGQGYVLTSPAIRRISEFFTSIIMKQFYGMEALAQGSHPHKGDLAQAQSPVLAAGTETVEAGLIVIEDEKDESQIKMSTQNARALKKEEEDSLILENTESTTSDLDAQKVCAVEIAPGVTTAKILQFSAMLEGFEDGVYMEGVDCNAIHPRLALGWLAHCLVGYKSQKIDFPARLAHTKLKNPEQPKPFHKFYEGWESYLPDDFLMAIGLLKLTCDVCTAEFSNLDDLKAHKGMMMVCEIGCGAKFHTVEEVEAHHKTHAPNVTIFEALPTDHRGAKAWALVKDALKNDMPKESFETWARDAEAVDFEKNNLKVVVRNAYARDWLESRLGDKVNAMLKTYLHEIVTVSFVVGKIAEEDSEWKK